MKRFWPVLAVVLMVSCSPDKPAGPAELIATDSAFSRMSEDKGLNAAFIYYAADSVVKLREGDFPVIGKSGMVKALNARPDSGMILKWRPVKAEVGNSDDLGYTFGVWELYLKAKDTTMYGNYITIWRKQADGTWKYVLDGGTNTPKPVY